MAFDKIKKFVGGGFGDGIQMNSIQKKKIILKK